ncbi:hypothetical protein LEP1GSC083_1291 [Leptospira interrogans serovar Pyrogenes str. L0374]|uniref:Uncharacterized protein n=1 Tax=Leptospira interrogans serovar Pyrogenes str. L0374 TaxID=1049928 RepID=M6KVZ5_LEPIR|nr:hypothetical protein LEP1GSC083_1291 [Leptospira interrogans serovar Pyrogenes str. L0374]
MRELTLFIKIFRLDLDLLIPKGFPFSKKELRHESLHFIF